MIFSAAFGAKTFLVPLFFGAIESENSGYIER